MDGQTENNHSWLDPLIRKMLLNLGKNFKNIRYKVTTPSYAKFMSNLFLVEIASNDDEGKIAVVVKKPVLEPEVRKLLRMDAQFHNEILFYTKFAKDSSAFARCIYTEEKPPDDTVIVLENVIEQRGYDMCKEKYDIPLEYTLAAFREIARFHAKAYVLKERHREEFFDLIRNIKKDRYDPNESIRFLANGTASRSVKFLRKQGYDQRFCNKLEAHLENAYENVLLKAIEAEQPLAVLCHGDFTVNNVLFKRENGKLVALLIDFAMIWYGTATMDLSTFLCLHCAKNLDKDTLNSILKVYHDSLIRCLEENDIDCTKYTYEALLEDFKKKALYGFIIASFFLPTQMGRGKLEPEECIKQGIAHHVKEMRELGGDEVSEVLAGILLKLKDFGCLDHLV